MSSHYFVLGGGSAGRTLVWRMGDPGSSYPQSVSIYNSITVVAFVMTNPKTHALDYGAFELLLSMVEADLRRVDMPTPKYLLRYDYGHFVFSE